MCVNKTPLMSVRLTPLSRNQLLDLEALIRRSHSANNSVRGQLQESPTVRPLGSGRVKAHHQLSRSSSNVAAAGMSNLSCSFHDATKQDSWGSTEKALYLVWWSFRPANCKECGTEDSWAPSAEDEYRCGHCGSGAGTTAISDNVEEFGVRDDDDDDSDGEQGGGLGGGDNAMGASSSGENSVVGLYQFFLAWIQVLASSSLTETTVPSGQVLPQVVRTAFDLSSVLVLPSTPSGGVMVIRSAALYLSLVTNKFSVPFPLFAKCGSAPSVNEFFAAMTTDEHASGTAMTADPSSLLPPPSRSEPLLWLDVIAAAEQVGIPMPEFFESSTVSRQYMQNTMALLAETFHPPSILWHVDRLEGREATLRALSTRIHPQLSARWSPEHVAAVVVLELCREYDAQYHPLTSGNDSRVINWVATYAEDARLRLSNVTPDVVDGGHSLLPTSAVADLLLRMIAHCFHCSPLELCEVVAQSGVYSGPTNCWVVLPQFAQSGDFSVMALHRRLTPFVAPWLAVYRALHSEDRLPLLAALNHVAGVASRDKEVAAAKVVQRICRKHGGASEHLFHYAIRCVDPQEQHLHGLYVCTYVSPKCAVFTCIRSARKTITYHSFTKTISVCYLGSKERILDQDGLQVVWAGPLVATVEGPAAKYVMDCCRSGLHHAEWCATLQRLSVCSALRKSSRTSPFPTWAFGTIRDHLSEAAMTTNGDAQLSGTANAAAFSASVLSRQAQRDFIAAVHPSLIRGASDERVLEWYHTMCALIEERCEMLCGAFDESLSSAELSVAQFQQKVFGSCPRLRHGLSDAEECMEDLVRCVKALRSGIPADACDEAKRRSTRRRRREEELRQSTWSAEN